MAKLLFISHPDVVIDPERPVPSWRLSTRGIDRMRRFAERPDLKAIQKIWSSTETKAIESAGVLAGVLGIGLSVDPRFNEIDRSATGFLSSGEHEAVADQFFALPNKSIHNWERAVDAQKRVVSALEAVTHRHQVGDIAIVGHGGVGTLLLCHLANLPISRDYDQPFQGHYWTYSLETNSILHQWRMIAERDFAAA
ncbi:MAG TPA: histidine phosphatase family protein [Ochrobactrum sp.]|nr:histidine phosphatase family protein [Ochrobactrum sp.]